jgi:tRNA G10  N-methylase Trm11
MIKHPARYTEDFIPVFARMIGNRKTVYDPMAGTGERLLQLKEQYLPSCKFIGTEIEPEWAKVTPSIVVCQNSFDFLRYQEDCSWDTILVSPPYGNRMADKLGKGKWAETRNSYAVYLGRELSIGNSGSLQWGEKYKSFHSSLWKECVRVLKINGVFILNIKDHIRKMERQYVTDWHIETLSKLGLKLLEHVKIDTPSLKNGQNAEARIPYESIVSFEKCA